MEEHSSPSMAAKLEEKLRIYAMLERQHGIGHYRVVNDNQNIEIDLYYGVRDATIPNPCSEQKNIVIDFSVPAVTNFCKALVDCFCDECREALVEVTLMEQEESMDKRSRLYYEEYRRKVRDRAAAS